MTIASTVVTIIDCGGRRSGIDRRQFSYTDHLPARRSNKDRRKTLERRSKIDPRSGLDRRTTEHSMKIKKIKREDLLLNAGVHSQLFQRLFDNEFFVHQTMF